MQLVAYGAQDIYLTGNPQITFFKVVYRRHTNFSMETISQTLDGDSILSSTSNEASCTIARNGDLIHKMYVTSSTNDITHGSEIVQSAELEIGGQKIDKHTHEWNNVWNELTTPDSKAPGLKAMQCETQGRSGSDLSVGFVQIPLNFYFCRNPGLALPLIALQYHEVKIKFIFCKSSDIGDIQAAIKFHVDYIFLDTDERRRFAQVSHEYLIEQVQIQQMTNDKTQELIFNHPVKELIWTTSADNNYNTALLKLNGHDRFEKQEEAYFQLRQPFDYHTSVPKINLTLDNQRSGDLVSKNQLEKVLVYRGVSNIPTGAGIFELFRNEDGAEQNDYNIQDGGDGQGVVFITLKSNFITDFDVNHLSHSVVLIVGSGSAFGPKSISGRITGIETEVFQAQDTSEGQVTFDDTLGATPINLNSSGGGDARVGIIFERVIFNTDEIPNNAAANIDFQITGFHIINKNGENSKSYTSEFGKKINVYSFALRPEEHQPSGTCNFSRIDTSILEFGASPTGTNGNIYAVNYNVLRIMSGMGGLAYSN